MKQFTLEEIAIQSKGQLFGNGKHIIKGASDLASADKFDISFLSNMKYKQAMRASRAGAIFIEPSLEKEENQNYIEVDNPSKAFQQIIEIFKPAISSGFEGIHPTAVIHETCEIGEGVQIGPNVVVDQHTKIGDRTRIGAGTSIGAYVQIGKDCLVNPNVTIREECILGNNVVLQPGVVIGSCGFGFLEDREGHQERLKQLGNVVLEDDVDIGANSTIDRARFKSTVIGRGTKMNNCVVIGHGVEIGEDNVIVAQTGIAGSTKTGKQVMFGGHVAVNGHIEIVDNVKIAAKSGVTKSIKKSGKYNGIPAQPLDDYNRMTVLLRNIGKLHQEVKELKEGLRKKG